MSSKCLQIYREDAIKTAESFGRKAETLHDGSDDACRDYSRMLAELHFRMETAFTHVAYSLRPIQEEEARISCWKDFISLCDEVLVFIKELRDNTPDCGEPSDFDFLLDLRQDAAERCAFFEPITAE